ncbi:hypothetical protein M0R45_015952 [Rubus argutus]|uniref:Uncharacterized protein n=1 Tax=Rubus argutus TaxID=59490 RepID=A0AAW1XRQ6_RUBAR
MKPKKGQTCSSFALHRSVQEKRNTLLGFWICGSDGLMFSDMRIKIVRFRYRNKSEVPVLSKAMIMERQRNLGDLVDVADNGDGIRTS